MNGRRIDQFRLPIVTALAGTLPSDFHPSSFLERLRDELEGDGFLRALRADLAAGHEIQRVTFQRATAERDAQYVFLLSRLGTLTTHEVGAGSLAVDNLLTRRRQRLASIADETLRAAFQLDRACRLFSSWGTTPRTVALKALAAEVGGPHSTPMANVFSDEPTNSRLSESVQLALQSKVRELVTNLTLDLRYRYDEAATIIDDALATLIIAG
jgi:hypothetical protein